MGGGGGSDDWNPANWWDHLSTSESDSTKSLQAGMSQQNKDAFDDAMLDPSVDNQTKQEIKYMRDNRKGDSGAIKKLADASREGKGIYAVRHIDEAQRKLITDMPGRRQLSPTYGKK